MPHQFVKITDNRYDDIMGTLERLHKEEDAQAIVTGDIDNVHHRRVWKDACKKLGVQLMMPLWDRPLNLIPGNRRRKRIMEMEQNSRSKSDSQLHRPKILHPRMVGTPNRQKMHRRHAAACGSCGERHRCFRRTWRIPLDNPRCTTCSKNASK